MVFLFSLLPKLVIVKVRLRFVGKRIGTDRSCSVLRQREKRAVGGGEASRRDERCGKLRGDVRCETARTATLKKAFYHLNCWRIQVSS